MHSAFRSLSLICGTPASLPHIFISAANSSTLPASPCPCFCYIFTCHIADSCAATRLATFSPHQLHTLHALVRPISFGHLSSSPSTITCDTLPNDHLTRRAYPRLQPSCPPFTLRRVRTLNSPHALHLTRIHFNLAFRYPACPPPPNSPNTATCSLQHKRPHFSTPALASLTYQPYAPARISRHFLPLLTT